MVTIRRLGPGDAAVVMAAAELFDSPPLPDATARFLAERGHHLLMAFDGETAVGFVSGVETTHPDKGTELVLYELAVAPAARGAGAGRALTEALAALGRERGCYGMWVLTDEDNAAARRTYAAAGGRETKRQVMVEWDLRTT
ncbi:MAG TPA: GNAT family N-acetyltransferase [Frankiaceae bacterium]|nr:GNAT family N-acetyltransferase [Frankiaceae bacterium]